MPLKPEPENRAKWRGLNIIGVVVRFHSTHPKKTVYADVLSKPFANRPVKDETVNDIAVCRGRPGR